MAKKRVGDVVEELVLPIIDESKLELVDIEFVKEGPDWFLRVYIDKDGGVTLDDCKIVSNFISEKLDEVDPISQSYYLEVSSPGLDRTLKKERDFEKYSGRKVIVNLYHPLDGKKVLEGELLGLRGDELLLKMDGERDIEIPREKIAKVKLDVIVE